MSITLLFEKFKLKYPEKKVRQFIFTFYVVGIVGLSFPVTHIFFVHLIPFALLLSAFILLPYQEDDFRRKTVVFFAAIFVVSFAVEAIGVNTGKIFGQYIYDNGLGVKCFGTPLIIGLNWALLVIGLTTNLPSSSRTSTSSPSFKPAFCINFLGIGILSPSSLAFIICASPLSSLFSEIIKSR